MMLYTLYEMSTLIKMGLWQGGEVETLGYMGEATATNSGEQAGLCGVYIGYDTMIERCERSDQGSGCTLELSLYDPYESGYKRYLLESIITSREELIDKIEEIVLDRRAPYVWSHNIQGGNIYAIERRYSAQHTSMRSGAIDRPRRSKIFGR